MHRTFFHPHGYILRSHFYCFINVIDSLLIHLTLYFRLFALQIKSGCNPSTDSIIKSIIIYYRFTVFTCLGFYFCPFIEIRSSFRCIRLGETCHSTIHQGNNLVHICSFNQLFGFGCRVKCSGRGYGRLVHFLISGVCLRIFLHSKQNISLQLCVNGLVVGLHGIMNDGESFVVTPVTVWFLVT